MGKIRLNNLEVVNVICRFSRTVVNGAIVQKVMARGTQVYTHMNRRATSEVLDRVFDLLHEQNVQNLPSGILSLDSTSIKVYPDATGA